jgi:hypothetical protein
LPGRRRRRSTLLAAGVVVSVVAVASTLVAVSSGGAGPAVEAFAVPASYHVTYDVTTAQESNGSGSESTEQLWVRRPFDSVDITYDGAPPGTTPSLTLVYRLGVQVLEAANAQAGLLHVPAGAAPPDVRADVVVPAAVRAHELKPVGHAAVLGRRCQVFRSAAPLRTGPLPRLRSQSSYVDTCIDRAGIVLRETQVSGGRIRSDRRAVLVQTGAAALAGASFDLPGTATPFDSGGGAFTPLTLTSRPPGSSWAPARLPGGFRHLGRFAVVPPQPQLFGQGGNGYGSMGLPGGLVTEMDDVFVRGADVIVLQQGSTLNGAAFRPPANAVGVDLGPLGRGQLLIAGNATTVVAEPGNGKGFVRLSGTLATDELLALMRGLVKQPGGTLTRLPPATAAGAGG